MPLMTPGGRWFDHHLAILEEDAIARFKHDEIFHLVRHTPRLPRSWSLSPPS